MATRSWTNGGFIGTATTALSVDVPSGAAINDIAVVEFFVGSDVTITAPTGFVELASTGFIGGRGNVRWFWKRLTTAETGSWAFTASASTQYAGSAALFSGREETGNPFDFTSITNTPSHVAQPDAVSGTASAGADLVFVPTQWNGGAPSLTASGTGATYVAKFHDTDSGMHLFVADNVTGGSVTAQPSATTSTDTWWVVFGALAESSAVTPGETTAALGVNFQLTAVQEKEVELTASLSIDFGLTGVPATTEVSAVIAALGVAYSLSTSDIEKGGIATAAPGLAFALTAAVVKEAAVTATLRISFGMFANTGTVVTRNLTLTAGIIAGSWTTPEIRTPGWATPALGASEWDTGDIDGDWFAATIQS